MNTTCKQTYVSPAILRQVAFAPGESLLVGSAVNDLNVTSTGQEVQDYDFTTGTGFNHDWQ